MSGDVESVPAAVGLDLGITGHSVTANQPEQQTGSEADSEPFSPPDPFRGLRPTVFTPAVDASKPRPAIEQLKLLLQKTLRIAIEDGYVRLQGEYLLVWSCC